MSVRRMVPPKLEDGWSASVRRTGQIGELTDVETSSQAYAACMVPERREAAVPERVSAPPEVTITRRVGHGLTLALLGVGQVLSTVWMFAIELTSGSRLLSRAAFAG